MKANPQPGPGVGGNYLPVFMITGWGSSWLFRSRAVGRWQTCIILAVGQPNVTPTSEDWRTPTHPGPSLHCAGARRARRTEEVIGKEELEESLVKKCFQQLANALISRPGFEQVCWSNNAEDLLWYSSFPGSTRFRTLPVLWVLGSTPTRLMSGGSGAKKPFSEKKTNSSLSEHIRTADYVLWR